MSLLSNENKINAIEIENLRQKVSSLETEIAEIKGIKNEILEMKSSFEKNINKSSFSHQIEKIQYNPNQKEVRKYAATFDGSESEAIVWLKSRGLKIQ
jgi:hypothetical protein